ncbi:MAG: exo-alpha-sialidase [Frankiales bacterium]|nr:exo-alpha-sialidase [Frankiales bacterium]
MPRSRRRVALASASTATAALAAVALLPAGTSYAATFGTPVVVSGSNASEPGVDVAPDGTLYVNAPVGVLSNIPGSPSLVFRSDDGGSSWKALPSSLKANQPGGGDSDIAIAPDGRLSETDLWLGDSTVATSKDKGETWTAQPVQGPPVQDRQWVTAVSGGRVYHVVHQIPTGLWVARSVDSGLTYPQQVVAATALDQTGCVCPPGNIVSEDGGLLGDKVGGVYATSDGGVGFYRSTNGGLTFTNTRPGPASGATTNGAFPVVADGGNGKLAVVWQAVQGNSSTVWFTTSNDFGATWAAAKQIVTAGTSLYPWVAYRGGKIAVSLYHTDANATPDTAPAGAQWFESYLESTDGGATFSALQAADSTPVKTGPVCTGGINCSANRELGDFQQVAIDNAGKAVMSYVHSIDNSADTEIRFVKQA